MKSQITTDDIEHALENMLKGVDEQIIRDGGEIAFNAIKSSDPISALKTANELANEFGYEPIVDRILNILADLV